MMNAIVLIQRKDLTVSVMDFAKAHHLEVYKDEVRQYLGLKPEAVIYCHTIMSYAALNNNHGGQPSDLFAIPMLIKDIK